MSRPDLCRCAVATAARGRRLTLVCTLIASGVLGFSTPGHADAVLAWNNELLDIIQQTSSLLVDSPPEVAREMSIVDSAMFDAANAASGSQFPALAYSGGSVANASMDAAALSAGYTAMEGIFGNVVWSGNQTNSALMIGSQTVPANTLASGFGGSASVQSTVLNEIQSAYTNALAALTGTPASVSAGVNLGVVAGNDNLAAAGYTILNGAAVNSAYATDGSAAALLIGLQPNTPTGSGTTPGVYVPPSTRPEMTPTWATVAPVGGMTNTATRTGGNNIPSLVSSVIPGPPAISTQAYASGLLQVECAGSSQPLSSLPANVQSACAAGGYMQETTAQARSALFWNDPGTTFQPPGHWLQIAENVAQGQNLTELQEARLTALVSQSEDDAGIAAWAAKYENWNGVGPLWRPTTAITTCGSGAASWNAAFTSCDPTWSSLIATPPHPDYVAGHPAFSGAAATILDNFFGTDTNTFSSTSNSYCNGGGSTTVRSASDITIVACTVGATSGFAYNPSGGNPTWATSSGCTGAGGAFTSGSVVSCTIGGTTYTYYPTIFSMNESGSSDTGGCTDAGGTLGTDAISGLTTCVLNGSTYYYDPNVLGCNDIVNGGTNDSPLICPITETFDSFSAASNGPNGAEYSRIAGGIHTPFSVADALTLGNAIGEQVASDNNIPEPASPSLLLASSGAIGLFIRRRKAGRRMARASRMTWGSIALSLA